MLAPSDIHIHRLHLRGPAEAQQRLGRELQQAQWPHAHGDEYVLIRQVRARAEPHRLKQTLLQQARHCIEHDSNPENVVRFANLQALLASLITDLTLGQAPRRWYWQRWAPLFNQAAGRAVASLMADHLPHLNGVIAVLAQRQMLRTLWQTLQPEDAAQLLRELNWKQGYRITVGGELPASSAPPTATFALPAALKQRWASAVADLPATDLRVRLACVLAAQEWLPLMLWQAPQAALAAVFTQIGGATTPQTTSSATAFGDGLDHAAAANHSHQYHTHAAPAASNNTAGTQPDTRTGPVDGSTQPAVNDHADMPAPTQSQPPQQQAGTQPPPATTLATTGVDTQPSDGPGASTPGPAHSQTQAQIEPEQAGSHQPQHPLQQLRLQPPAPKPLPDQFETQQGGVLYLLNFLNRSELQTLMGDYWQTLPNGWLWLYRVAQLLGFDASDPLAAFIARQLGLEHSADLARLPPLPQADDIQQLAQQWYGPLWQPSLLTLAATIGHNPSHVDLYTSPGNVRIEVRLAGLDINPGWLPWLGRVVNFHYEQPS